VHKFSGGWPGSHTTANNAKCRPEQKVCHYTRMEKYLHEHRPEFLQRIGLRFEGMISLPGDRQEVKLFGWNQGDARP
jgi:hypothetical protein